MKDIVIAGIQGCGKGTQGALLLNHFPHLKYFEAGAILRALQSRPNAIGEYVTKVIDKGNLLKDEIMIRLFETFLETVEDGEVILVDGFPRQLKQAHLFIEAMEKAGRKLQVIVLDLDESVAKKRLSGRRICKACGSTHHIDGTTSLVSCPDCHGELYQREDDKSDTSIATRISLFHTHTRPVIDLFESLGVVTHINGEQSTEQVFADILAAYGA